MNFPSYSIDSNLNYPAIISLQNGKFVIFGEEKGNSSTDVPNFTCSIYDEKDLSIQRRVVAFAGKNGAQLRDYGDIGNLQALLLSTGEFVLFRFVPSMEEIQFEIFSSSGDLNQTSYLEISNDPRPQIQVPRQIALVRLGRVRRARRFPRRRVPSRQGELRLRQRPTSEDHHRA